MNFQKEIMKKQKRTEIIILLIYTLCDVNMIVGLLRHSWSYSSCILLLLFLGAAWVLYVKQYHSYENRNLIITGMIQCSILLYAFQVQDFDTVLSNLYIFSCLVGFYGVSSCIYLSTGTVLIFLGAHIFGSSLDQDVVYEKQMLFKQLLNLLVFDFVLIIWIKGRIDSRNKIRDYVQQLQTQVSEQFALIGLTGTKIQEPIHQIKQECEKLSLQSESETVAMGLGRIQGICDYVIGRSVDVVDYAAIQTNAVVLHEKEYDVVALAEDCINSAMLLHQMTGVEFVFDFDAEIPKNLIGDEEKIRRVIFQLIGNAFQFTKEGFVGMIIAGRRESYGYNLIITIRDSGCGMSHEVLEGILSNQRSVNKKEETEKQGIGIGLFVCKKLVERMGGTMMIKSEVEKGTQVQIVIPQKMGEMASCISLPTGKKIHTLVYVNMEQFRMIEVRDAYMETLSHIANQLPVESHMCRNLSELKRRTEGEYYTHVIITDSAYHEDEAYFDLLSVTTKVILMMDRDEEVKINNNRVYYVYKPFFIVNFATVLWDIEEPGNYSGKPGIYAGYEIQSQEPKRSEPFLPKDQEQDGQPNHQQKDENKEQEKLVIGDLDINTAILYCGGEKSFLMVLLQFILHAAEMREELVKFYEAEDWKNYVIKVHGLKSTMLSLGAKTLSEQAKELEYAGKSEKYDLIHQKMDELLAEYDRVVEMVASNPVIARQVTIERQNEADGRTTQVPQEMGNEAKKEALTQEMFASFIDEMEDCSYELDETKMTMILDKLETFSYRGRDLHKELKRIREKMEQSDLLSAVSSLQQIKEKLDKEEEI